MDYVYGAEKDRQKKTESVAAYVFLRKEKQLELKGT